MICTISKARYTEEMQKALEREQAKNIKSEPGRVFGINRNTVCPCGSGKKYKHCCLKLK